MVSPSMTVAWPVNHSSTGSVMRLPQPITSRRWAVPAFNQSVTNMFALVIGLSPN